MGERLHAFPRQHLSLLSAFDIDQPSGDEPAFITSVEN
jgi:hypothetical protein